MKRLLIFTPFLFVLFSTELCYSGVPDTYLEAQNSKVLTVPRHLSSSKISKYFVIQSSSVQPSAIPVPPSSKLEHHQRSHPLTQSGLPSSALHLSTGKAEPYLWLNQSPSEAYNTVRIGLAKKNVTVANVSAEHDRIEILDTYATFDRIKDETPLYHVILQPAKRATHIRIRSPRDTRINPNTSRRLLRTIMRGIQLGTHKNNLFSWIKSRNGKYKYD